MCGVCVSRYARACVLGRVSRYGRWGHLCAREHKCAYAVRFAYFSENTQWWRLCRPRERGRSVMALFSVPEWRGRGLQAIELWELLDRLLRCRRLRDRRWRRGRGRLSRDLIYPCERRAPEPLLRPDGSIAGCRATRKGRQAVLTSLVFAGGAASAAPTVTLGGLAATGSGSTAGLGG